MSFSEEMSISGVTHNITIRLTMQLELSYLKRTSGLITAKLSYLQFSLFYKAEEDKYDSNISISFFCYICRFLLFYWISFPLVSDDYASFRWLFSSNKELGFFLIFSSDRHPLCHVFRRPWLVLSKTSHWPTLKIAKDDVVRELPNGKCWK